MKVYLVIVSVVFSGWLLFVEYRVEKINTILNHITFTTITNDKNEVYTLLSWGNYNKPPVRKEEHVKAKL